MTDTSSLTDTIVSCHQALDEFFLVHQEAVLLGHLEAARALLAGYAELHDLHMRFEDEHLIPALAALGDAARWPAALYDSEHRKIEQLLEKVDARLVSIRPEPMSSRRFRRRLLALLDYERTFKGVSEHHQEREESGMLPELDRHRDAAWRAGVLAAFLVRWHECLKRNTARLEDARRTT